MATSTIKLESPSFVMLDLTSSVSLTASIKIIGLSAYDQRLSSDLAITNDGGARCLRDGTVRVSGFMLCSGLTSGDKVAMQISRYRNNAWSNSVLNPELYSQGIGTAGNVSFPQVAMVVQTNDIIYLRGYNIAAARGSIVNAGLFVEYI